MDDVANSNTHDPPRAVARHAINVLALGGVIGAIGASSCCVLPLALFMLGIGGAWVGRLTALSAYQPMFVAAAVACLAGGFWLHARHRPLACVTGSGCGHSRNRGLVAGAMFLAAGLVGLSLAFPYVAPFLLGV